MSKALRNWQAVGAVALAALLHAPAAHAQATANAQGQSAVASVDPARLVIAREIVGIAFPTDKREAIFGGAMDAMLEQMRATMFSSMKNDPGAEKIVNGKVDGFVAGSKVILRRHIPSMLDAVAEAYTREFSEAELTELRAFAQTNTGTHFLQRSSAVMSDPSFRASNEAYMRDLMPSIEKMRTELLEDLTRYFMEHPPKASTDS
ncbi:DUF2059 domain-containing protein [Novosphingobium sp.]|uniref:DUF2059 domain-containing protein n=1 Tax=Novosphingobium sp. TaxID=1874826 RepID=UPI002628821D|nr:DUF2059 domain-containing protein [Novosphingobium sp.]